MTHSGHSVLGIVAMQNDYRTPFRRSQIPAVSVGLHLYTRSIFASDFSLRSIAYILQHRTAACRFQAQYRCREALGGFPGGLAGYGIFLVARVA
jgi:hypothetical protein